MTVDWSLCSYPACIEECRDAPKIDCPAVLAWREKKDDTMTDDTVERFGKVKYSTILRYINKHREALNSLDIVAAQETWSKLERWTEAFSPNRINQAAMPQQEVTVKDAAKVLLTPDSKGFRTEVYDACEGVCKVHRFDRVLSALSGQDAEGET